VSGFREWATLEPLAGSATAEIESLGGRAQTQGYDALNKAWLVSGLLVLRGFARHLCPAVSGYSWNLIAGHRRGTSEIVKKQIAEEGLEKAIFEPRNSLPRFEGGLLDYHLKLLIPKQITEEPFGRSEAEWIAEHFEVFNRLAADDERFRFALEASVDWRFSKDPRAAIARLWAGIESLFNISSELVFRISLMASTVLDSRGPERLTAFKHVKKLYGLRSKAVHGDPISEDLLYGAMNDSFDLLRKLLIDAVVRGSVRTEEDFEREIFS
jgi:hypothetical protein